MLIALFAWVLNFLTRRVCMIWAKDVAREDHESSTCNMLRGPHKWRTVLVNRAGASAAQHPADA